MLTRLNIGLNRIQTTFMETFGLGKAAALAAILLVISVSSFAAYWFFHSAPPDTITITSGPEGSVSQMNAEKYSKILARNGVKLKILPSEGSQENLKRLNDPSIHVDIGFVQSGVTGGLKVDRLVSLGSISYQPLLIFYRGDQLISLLSGFAGKRLAVGPEGSGSRTLTLTLLAANGIEPGGETALLNLEADDATKALIEGKVDAVFLMGDSASVQNMRMLLRTERIHLFDFTQADGYTRRIDYLNKLVLPKGSIDFGKDIPSHDVTLIGPTIQIIARPDLHPALSDLLIEAAQEVHGSASLLRRRGEFPSPLEYEFRLSSDASRYYKSGKSFLYRYLPFWMASLVNRIIVVFVPLIVVLIPGLKFIPVIFRWRIRLRIVRWYRALLALEQDLVVEMSPKLREELLARLDRIEEAVNKMKIPASFAEQFYVLRGDIAFVRGRLANSGQRNVQG
ncbi:MAG: TAXI family TRAP transporter solute-binding subunit [Dissulfurispiraceae bacterium]|jgi:TRAP-type uncharacterized transport system substrate-binding protein